MAKQQKQMITPTKAQQEAIKKQKEIAALIERNVKEFKEFILVIDLPQRFITTGFLMLDGEHNYMVVNTMPWSSLADSQFMMRTHNFLHGMKPEENNGFTPPDNFKILELPSSIPPVFLTASENAGVYAGAFLAEVLFNDLSEDNKNLCIKLFDVVPSLTTIASKTKIYFGSGSTFTNSLGFTAYAVNGDVNKPDITVADIVFGGYIIRRNGEKLTVPFKKFILWDSESKRKVRTAIELDYAMRDTAKFSAKYKSAVGLLSKMADGLGNPKLCGSMSRQKFNKSITDGELKDAAYGTVIKLTDGKYPKYKLKVLDKTWVDLPFEP